MKSEVIRKASNVQDAINAGLEELGVERDQVEVKVLDPGGGWLSWFGLSRAVVRVAMCQGEIAAQHICSEMLKRMNVDALVAAKESDGECRITISGGGRKLIGRNGEVIDALEYLIERILNTGGKEERTRIYLDIDEYRLEREESLRSMARRQAEKALDTGGLVETDALPSNERRIIHTYLKEFGRVETRSLGGGHHRRIQIYPIGFTPPESSRNRNSGRRPQGRNTGSQNQQNGNGGEGKPPSRRRGRRGGRRRNNNSNSGDNSVGSTPANS
jgi:spoIIIJ-associated protein